jgi:hypothetical protein
MIPAGKPDAVPDLVASKPRGSAGDFPRVSTAGSGRVVASLCLLDGRAMLAVETKTLSAGAHPLSAEPERLMRELRHVIAEANSLLAE